MKMARLIFALSGFAGYAVMASNVEAREALSGRPGIHFTANSWINDPCAPGYDPHTGTYHLFFQCEIPFNMIPTCNQS